RLLVPKERLADRLDFLHNRRNPDTSGEAWEYQRTNNRHSLRDSAFLSSLAGEMQADSAEA
ncbi:MAG: NADH-quinone oxidoreductase subunit I, partial [Bacteroidetes bacterium]|nr:NADH-quinone oxidoreductase subunit I [Bacteroidota bacterium]